MQPSRHQGSLRSRRLRPLALTLAVAALAACSSAPEVTGAEGQDLYGLGSLGTPWPNGQVPVCYQNPADHPELQALIPGILLYSWGTAANINFTGFGKCSGSGKEVTITFVAGTNGVTDNLGLGNRSVSLVSDDTAPNRPHFTYEVIHEFGHALGFAHEMKRPDNWPGGVELQCTPTPGNNPNQYAAQPGGLNLTANYDPFSIMNYCDPNQNQETKLSVGDILAVSSPNAYGPENGCTFTTGATSCTWATGLHAEETFTVPTLCPTPQGSWVLQSFNGAAWTNVASSCPGGQQVGTCGTNTSPTSFTFGYQAEGGAVAGPAIGSVQTVRMCDQFKNCTPSFGLTVTDCATKADQLYLSPGNDPLQVTQDGTGVANILMYGPWVQTDGGASATAVVVNNPIPGAVISLFPGSSINGAGVVEMMVTASLTTPAGTYLVDVKVTDRASAVPRTARLAVQVLPCAPSAASNVCGGIFATGCGVKSIGCGLTTDCGGCASGDWCSSGFCCPTGSTFDIGTDTCVSNTPPPRPTCPPARPYCDATGTCATPAACARANGGGCKGTTCS